MLRKLLLALVGVYVLAAAAWVVSAGVVRDAGRAELLNVACDPTRELWAELNAAFVPHYQATSGQTVTIKMSHGGSATQAGLVVNGLKADVVTLALWSDTDQVRKAGLMAAGWEGKLPNRSLPFVSTIVFVVRKGDRRFADWPDLARPGVSVITPNPKTSGNGKWSFLALWGSVTQAGKGEDEARRFVAAVFRNVPKLDNSARAATLTFQKGIGDVHLTWENEAHLEVAESNGELEIVYPPRSILAEPHVAVVGRNAAEKGTTAAATDYLTFLYTEAAQKIIARHHYRPTDEQVKRLTADRFPPIDLFPVTAVGKDWEEVHARFFAAGGEFDRLYAPGAGK